MTKSKPTVPTEFPPARSEAAAIDPSIWASGLIIGVENGTLQLNHDLVSKSFGSNDEGFIKGIMNGLLCMSDKGGGEIDRHTLDFIGGALMEIAPRNGLEAILVAQMISNHILTMKFARLTMTSDTFERSERLEAMFTKMARTTTTQVEALHKLRNGGKQKVKVEHVHVHQGGQAIVGNVERGVG
jgi:hypothetical protein